VATDNARELALPVSFVISDLLAGVPGRFDAVLANLPYVAADAALPPDVALYEPGRALFAADGGLALVRALVAQLEAIEFVALEIGEGQAGAVASLLGQAGYLSVQRRRDLAGIERVVVGRRGDMHGPGR
jgi:release factor glutamine methyltransferase